MSMAAVITAHSIHGMSAGTHLACRCDREWVPFSEYHAHLDEVLTKAGYGKVQEAQVEAWGEGWAAGLLDASIPGRKESTNPYRAGETK